MYPNIEMMTNRMTRMRVLSDENREIEKIDDCLKPGILDVPIGSLSICCHIASYSGRDYEISVNLRPKDYDAVTTMLKKYKKENLVELDKVNREIAPCLQG